MPPIVFGSVQSLVRSRLSLVSSFPVGGFSLQPRLFSWIIIFFFIFGFQSLTHLHGCLLLLLVWFLSCLGFSDLGFVNCCLISYGKFSATVFSNISFPLFPLLRLGLSLQVGVGITQGVVDLAQLLGALSFFSVCSSLGHFY